MKWYIYSFTLRGSYGLSFIEADDETALEKFLTVMRDLGYFTFQESGMGHRAYADLRITRVALVPVSVDGTATDDTDDTESRSGVDPSGPR